MEHKYTERMPREHLIEEIYAWRNNFDYTVADEVNRQITEYKSNFDEKNKAILIKNQKYLENVFELLQPKLVANTYSKGFRYKFKNIFYRDPSMSKSIELQKAIKLLRGYCIDNQIKDTTN